ncbi:MAG: hypothetical protein DMC60_00875 [Verrucomicrobia bacterium]|nr:MAG: hypothetical protein DMC60_00875 [Verrucomicrobiota bacterium]
MRAQITALHASGTLIVLADQSLLQKGRLAPYKLNDCSKTISSADCQDDACDGNATAALLTVYEPSGQSRAPARPGAKRDPLKRL